MTNFRRRIPSWDRVFLTLHVVRRDFSFLLPAYFIIYNVEFNLSPWDYHCYCWLLLFRAQTRPDITQLLGLEPCTIIRVQSRALLLSSSVSSLPSSFLSDTHGVAWMRTEELFWQRETRFLATLQVAKVLSANESLILHTGMSTGKEMVLHYERQVGDLKMGR